MLDIKNKCLLSKWLFKLLHEEGVWAEFLSNKYLGGKTLSQVTPKPTDSPFWRGILSVKNDFLRGAALSLAMAKGFAFGRILGWGICL